MSTAIEMQLKMAAADKMLARIYRRLEVQIDDLLVYGMHIAIGRTVCARRARKLRRRGEDVRRTDMTATGKSRYSWLRRIPPIEVYKP